MKFEVREMENIRGWKLSKTKGSSSSIIQTKERAPFIDLIFCTYAFSSQIDFVFTAGSKMGRVPRIGRVTTSSQHDYRRGRGGYARKVGVVAAAVLGHGDRHGARGFDLVLHLEAGLLLEA